MNLRNNANNANKNVKILSNVKVKANTIMGNLSSLLKNIYKLSQ